MLNGTTKLLDESEGCEHHDRGGETIRTNGKETGDLSKTKWRQKESNRLGMMMSLIPPPERIDPACEICPLRSGSGAPSAL